MKNGSCSATTAPWKHCPSLCHLDRSAAQWRDLRFDGPFLEMFFERGIMGQGPPKAMKNGSCSATTLPGSAISPLVIPTGADPDFLLRAASDVHVCGSP
jgi:hypothetical protein